MRRHVIAGYYGDKDDVTINVHSGETLTKVNLTHANRLGFGLGTALDDLAKKDVYPSEVGIDLLIVATHVQIADTRLSRKIARQDITNSTPCKSGVL